MAAFIVALCLEVGEKMSIPGVYGLVSPAEAVVGRPLTAGSVAGVHRAAENRAALRKRDLQLLTSKAASSGALTAHLSAPAREV
jgi:hypothetical protein